MNIAICDDDINVSKSLYTMLMEINTVHVNNITIFTDPDSLITEAERAPFDIVFIDVRLGDRSGIDVSKRMLSVSPLTHIIFMSGYDDYYIDVYDVEHVYFLRKPVSMEKLASAVHASQSKFARERRNILSLNDRHGIVRIPMDSIVFLEKNLRLVEIHMNPSCILTNAVYDPDFEEYVYSFYGKFSDIAPSLGAAFHQCHNSFIVNFNYISEMTGHSFIMNNKRDIPISKKFAQDVKTSFFEYIGY